MSEARRNKKPPKYLLPAVIVIWAFAGFMVYRSCSSPSSQKDLVAAAPLATPKLAPTQPEKFELLEVEKDPFLDKPVTKRTASAQLATPKAPTEELS